MRDDGAMSRWFADVAPTEAEVAAVRPGDDIVADADVVMDRAFTVDGAPDEVWPWLLQLGKQRAGWYLPHRLERIIPRGRRAIRRLDERWQQLAVGDVIPDYGGRHATFTVAIIEPPTTLAYESQRGKTHLTWAITLTWDGARPAGLTRVHLRLRLGPVRRLWLAEHVGGMFDLLTIAGMAAGLRERLDEP